MFHDHFTFNKPTSFISAAELKDGRRLWLSLLSHTGIKGEGSGDRKSSRGTGWNQILYILFIFNILFIVL